MSEEEKIKELAKHIPARIFAYDVSDNSANLDELHREIVALHLYRAGYRKQSVGEWETIPDYQPDKLIAYRHICSVCKTTYKDIRPHGHKYCHECGSKMKGGVE